MIRKLSDRDVNAGSRRSVQADLSHVSDDSDNLPRDVFFKRRSCALADQNAITEGITVRPELPSKRIRNDRDRRRIVCVAIAEQPASNQPNLEHVEVLRRDWGPVWGKRAIQLASDNGHTECSALFERDTRERDRRRFDAWQQGHAL
jgi:hypothetical protein